LDLILTREGRAKTLHLNWNYISQGKHFKPKAFTSKAYLVGFTWRVIPALTSFRRPKTIILVKGFKAKV